MPGGGCGGPRSVARRPVGRSRPAKSAARAGNPRFDRYFANPHAPGMHHHPGEPSPKFYQSTAHKKIHDDTRRPKFKHLEGPNRTSTHLETPLPPNIGPPRMVVHFWCRWVSQFGCQPGERWVETHPSQAGIPRRTGGRTFWLRLQVFWWAAADISMAPGKSF